MLCHRRCNLRVVCIRESALYHESGKRQCHMGFSQKVTLREVNTDFNGNSNRGAGEQKERVLIIEKIHLVHYVLRENVCVFFRWQVSHLKATD